MTGNSGFESGCLYADQQLSLLDQHAWECRISSSCDFFDLGLGAYNAQRCTIGLSYSPSTEESKRLRPVGGTGESQNEPKGCSCAVLVAVLCLR